MREFDVDLTEYITKGISPDRQHIRQKPGLADCKELIIKHDGLRPRPAIFNLGTDYGSFSDYPNPLLFDLINDIMISNTSGTFVYGEQVPLITDQAIEILDFGGYILINSEEGLHEFTVEDGIYTQPASPTVLNFTSICAYNKSQFFGVLNDTLYWSKVNLMDFTIDHTNMAGNTLLPFPGDGIRVMQLGANIICYGDEGVFVMTPVQQPAGGWRKVEFPQLNQIGLKSYFGLVDTGGHHLFVGNDNNLWKLDKELKLTMLGYENIFKSMTDINFTFVPMYGCTYISDSTNCYILTDTGLSRVEHYSRSIVPYTSADYKIAGYTNTSDTSDIFKITTLPIDFKLRAVKHIQALEMDIRSDSDIECAIEWRNSFKEDFRSTEWKRVNNAGVVHLPCSGVDFKIKIKGTLDDNFYLASLVAKIKYENKTTLRGKYAY